jgi:Spy/CpxP family protein refolding chaperone
MSPPMTRPLAQLVVALLLLLAAFASWTAARASRDMASQHERLMTLQDIPDYWAGRYDAPTANDDADSLSLLTAANASFRKAQRDSNGAPAVERLEQVMQSYVSVLKNGGFNRDAAYNYEYVSRLRDVMAKAKPRSARPPGGKNAPADDLPAGPTIHGRPGMHPPATRGEEFEVLTPMDYGEREAQPEPTPGRPLPRKG